MPLLSRALAGTRQRQHFILLLILALALILRVAVALLLPDQSQSLPDSIGYREAAQELRDTLHMSGHPYIMPLYPILVAITYPGVGQLITDIALSILTVWLVYALTDAIFGDRLCSLLAAFATAFYPHLIFFSVVGLTETLFITLVLAAFVCWYRGFFIPAAIFAILSILTRPIPDLLVPFLVAYFAIAIYRLPWTGVLRQLLIYGAVYCLMLAPWWLHNFHIYGGFVRLNLGSGLAIYSGNNPGNISGGIDRDLGAHMAQFDNIRDPIAHDAALKEAAFRHIRQNPSQFLEQAFLKLLRFWRLWPHTETYSRSFYVIASLASFTPVLLLACVYLLLWGRQDARRIAPLVIFGAYLTALHTVVPGSIRYRLPLEPLLIVMAATAAGRLIDMVRAKKSPEPPKPCRIQS
jgi:hypothetical protein